MISFRFSGITMTRKPGLIRWLSILGCCKWTFFQSLNKASNIHCIFLWENIYSEPYNYVILLLIVLGIRIHFYINKPIPNLQIENVYIKQSCRLHFWYPQEPLIPYLIIEPIVIMIHRDKDRYRTRCGKERCYELFCFWLHYDEDQVLEGLAESYWFFKYCQNK